jgi:DNA-directed RNA polymerase specialized sigma24 family protein
MSSKNLGRCVQVPASIPPLQGVSWETALTDDLGRVGTLYRKDGDRIWRALLAYSGDPDIASDALSEALTQALARGRELRDPAAWVWTASFRLAAGELKARGDVVPFTGEAGTYHMPEPVPHLLEALAQISPKQRMAVVLHDYADRPTDEIASLLGASRATVHVHLSRGRKRLRELLESTDG